MLLNASDLQEMMERSLFHQLLRPRVLTVDHAQLLLEIKLLMRDEFERQPGTKQWHGGMISAIIDTVGCYGLTLISSEPPPTINFRTDYLRPAIDTDLVASAKIRKAGRTIGVVDVDVVDDVNRLIAVGRACYSIQTPVK